MVGQQSGNDIKEGKKTKKPVGDPKEAPGVIRFNLEKKGLRGTLKERIEGFQRK